jgi:hypothetical protein
MPRVEWHYLRAIQPRVEWREDKEDWKIWGSLLPRRGYRILAQGFNPGNRPPGRRALTRNMVELRVTLAVEIGR